MCNNIHSCVFNLSFPFNVLDIITSTEGYAVMYRLRMFFPQATVGQHGLHEDEQTKKNAMASAEDLGEYKGR